MNRKFYKKIGIASAIMMASVFLSRVMGLFREMVIAYVAGAGGNVDAYQVAFIIPDILNHVAAGGFLSVTFIPIFSRYLIGGKQDDGWQVVSIILTCFGSLLSVVIGVAFIFAPQLITILAPGLNDPGLISDAVYMTRIILPAQFFFFAGGLFMAVQFSLEHFFIPALAPLIYNLGIILGGLFLGPWLGMAGFSWGVLAGSFLGNFSLQFWGAKRAGMKIQINPDIFHPDLKKYILLTLPLMVGLTMTFSSEFFLKFFGSFLPEGSIAALNYGLRVTLMLVGFFGQAVGTASFPFMTQLVAENKMSQMNQLLNDTLRYLALVIPISVLMMVLRKEVVRILFERGRFDASATEMTSSALAFLLVGAFAFAAQTVVVRGYYAMQNTLFPAVFGTLAVAISIPGYIFGMRLMGADGVGLAISVSAILQLVLLYALWNKKTENFGSRKVYAVYAKMVLLSIPVGYAIHRIRTEIYPEAWQDTLPGSFLICLVSGSLFFALILIFGYVFKISEIRGITNRVAKRYFK
ncbi:MAG: murein biosynthesis integral membrane protein MurJ [Desulfobacterales bacterium]